MATATQEGLCGLANELAMSVEDFYLTDDFVRSVFAHRDGDILWLRHSHIVA